MPDQPRWRVSTIIPAYNRADFLAETLGCLFAQTEPVHEIIVVDDGSTDDTVAVVAGFGDRVRYLRIFHSTLLVARSLFDEIGGYDPRFARTGSEDFEFTLRCAASAPIGAVLEPLVGIRRHGGNFSGNHLRALLGEVEILRHARA